LTAVAPIPTNETSSHISRRDETADTVHCVRCATTYLTTDTRIESVHRSAEGMVGYARCIAGHLTLHRLEEAYPKPPPPASVLALRAAWTAAWVAAERAADSQTADRP